jgi:CRISPR-associated endonuclease/helicase Cas3
MYSECAPLDSLIQRAGRCNRFDKIKKGMLAKYTVFPIIEKAKKYIYDSACKALSKTVDVLKANQGLLSEKTLMSMLETVYEDLDLKDEDYRKAEELVFGIHRHPVHSVCDTNYDEEKLTRMIDYVKIPIIPLQFYGEVERLLATKNKMDRDKIHLYEVSVSMPMLKKSKPVRGQGDMGLLNIYEIKHDEDIGILFDKGEDAVFDCAF